MALFDLVLGGGALYATARFGKKLMQGWARKYAGAEGVRVLNDVFKTYNWGASFIPGVGPLNFLTKATTGALMKPWKNLTNLRSTAISMNKEIQNSVGKIYGPKTYASLTQMAKAMSGGTYGKETYKALKGAYFNFAKSLKDNPMRRVGDLQKTWDQSLIANKLIGFHTDVITLRGHLLSGAQRVNAAALQAREASRLYGVAFASNAAVIGFPTLASSVATYAAGRSIWGRTRRRLRGYEPTV